MKETSREFEDLLEGEVEQLKNEAIKLGNENITIKENFSLYKVEFLNKITYKN